MFRKLGIFLIAIGALAMVLHALGIRFPSLKWFFSVGETFGWVSCSILILAGLAMVLFAPKDFRLSPQAKRQLHRFHSIKRGWWSLLALGFLVLLALLDNLIVGNRALIVSFDGKLTFPAFVDAIPATEFGEEGDGEPNYRALKEKFREEDAGNWVILPPVPWNPTLDSDAEQRATLIVGEDGIARIEGSGEPYSGLASTFYADSPETKRQEARYRRGLLDGPMEGWDRAGNSVEKAVWEQGEEVSREIVDPAKLADLESAEITLLTVVRYPPVPPSFKDKHFLGTDTSGNDIL
ncbi:MAG: hypothetical protein KDN19_08610, partial [Verrucomicrobiae bacterium]|nr:hypothetical protein [Verrucomicrobiae bacterium]